MLTHTFRKRQSVWLLIAIFTLVLYADIPLVSYAATDDNKEKTTVLTREKILDLAKTNYLQVRDHNLNVRITNARANYTQEQLKLGGSYSYTIFTPLATTVEELAKEVDNYSSLTPEQKEKVDEALRVQGQINNTLNLTTKAQIDRENDIGEQQWYSQTSSLNQTDKEASLSAELAGMERDRLELVAQYEVMKTYYYGLESQLGVRLATLEYDAAVRHVQDMKLLYKLGLVSKQEVEQAEVNSKSRAQILDRAKQVEKQATDMLRLGVGIKKDEIFVWPKLEDVIPPSNLDNADIHLRKLIDYKKIALSTEEAINSYQASAEEHQLTRNYLETVQNVEIQRLDVAYSMLEYKAKQLSDERDGLQVNQAMLENQEKQLKQSVKDNESLYKLGSISALEYEKSILEYERAAIEYEKVKLQYYVWQEKKRIAVSGVLL